VDDDVGSDATVLGGERGLLFEVAVRQHPGHLDHTPQLHLTPPAACLGVSKCGHEVAGLVSEKLLALVQRPDLLGEPCVGLPPADLELLEAPPDLAERVCDRLHHVLDRQLPLREVGRREVVLALQLRLVERDEPLEEPGLVDRGLPTRDDHDCGDEDHDRQGEDQDSECHATILRTGCDSYGDAP
jgi:hypothetical protein